MNRELPLELTLGSRGYFKSHEKPKSPRDLLHHRCINFRHGSQGMYRWEFDKRKRSLTVAVNGPLIVDETDLVIRAAVDGVGLAFLPEQHAEPPLTNGTFVRVLEDWCPPFPGYFLHYPSRRQQPASLAEENSRLKRLVGWAPVARIYCGRAVQLDWLVRCRAGDRVA